MRPAYRSTSSGLSPSHACSELIVWPLAMRPDDRAKGAMLIPTASASSVPHGYARDKPTATGQMTATKTDAPGMFARSVGRRLGECAIFRSPSAISVKTGWHHPQSGSLHLLWLLDRLARRRPAGGLEPAPRCRRGGRLGALPRAQGAMAASGAGEAAPAATKIAVFQPLQ